MKVELQPAYLPLRWVALCFGVTFAFYIAFIPRILLYSSPPTGDQANYLMETITLAEGRGFNVADTYARHEEDYFYSLAPHAPGFVGIAAPYPLPPQTAHSTARPAAEWYAYHLPGLPLVLAPAGSSVRGFHSGGPRPSSSCALSEHSSRQTSSCWRTRSADNSASQFRCGWDSRINDGALSLGHPRGLCYAPDGTLYVVDDRTLFQFSVQH